MYIFDNSLIQIILHIMKICLLIHKSLSQSPALFTSIYCYTSGVIPETVTSSMLFCGHPDLKSYEYVHKFFAGDVYNGRHSKAEVQSA